MPIRAENKLRYPPHWPAISRAIKDRAGWCCEGTPQYPDCRAVHGEPHPVTGARVVLTVAHMDHRPEAWDARTRAAGIAARRRAERAIGDLFATHLGGRKITDPIGRAILWPYGIDDC